MVITVIFVILMGLIFGGYGVFQLLLKKICSKKVTAVYLPEDEPTRRMPFYIYEEDGKKIYAYQQKLPAIGEEQPVRGESYEIYVSPRFPSLLITSQRLPLIQYFFAASCILLGVMIMVIAVMIMIL